MAQTQYNHGDVILRFSDASFSYNERRPILEEVNFSVRERAKVALMGQNGSGKSTIFELILSQLKLNEGAVNIKKREALPDENPIEESYVRFIFKFEKSESDELLENVSSKILG